ncbi:MAG: hypothetical protein M5U25_11325 [Planctomycetota bacterium]|nr:hypothetical protein [Planctomycetota bacterium]
MMKLAPLILLCLLSSGCGIVPQQAMAERQPGESEYWTEPRGRTDRIHNVNSETVFNRSKLVYQGERGSVYAPTIYIGGVDEWYTEYTPSPTPISAAFVQRLFRAESNIPGLVNCGLTDAEREEFAEPTAKALTEYGAAIILLKTQSVKFLDRTPPKTGSSCSFLTTRRGLSSDAPSISQARTGLRPSTGLKERASCLGWA